MEQLRIISSDDHMDFDALPPNLFVERLPRELRERAPRVVETADGPFWEIEGKLAGSSGRRATGLLVKAPLGYRPSDPKARLEDIDRDGLYATVIYGPTSGFRIEDRALKLACMRVYNDWASEFNAHEPNRLIALAQTPGWDPAVATEELQRVAKLCHKGAQIAMLESPVPLFERAWESFWEVAEELGLPVSFHLGGGLHSIQGRIKSWAHVALCSVIPMQLDEAMAGMIISGMLERHPKLRVVLGESGLGWVPYAIERMDMEHTKYREITEDYVLKRLPSEVFRDQMYVTYEEEGIGVKLIPEIGAGNVMWASDFPHGDSTWPNSLKAIEESLGFLPEADHRLVVSENAAQLYQIA
jgi:predicted TIM-barrel fold metal-dependent hydrolase